jgi:hypothetical protein
MLHLQASSRSNFLYGLAKGLGSQRQDGADSIFPTKQIIAGLVEYSINFFNASTVGQASIRVVTNALNHHGNHPHHLQKYLSRLLCYNM